MNSAIRGGVIGGALGGLLLGTVAFCGNAFMKTAVDVFPERNFMLYGLFPLCAGAGALFGGVLALPMKRAIDELTSYSAVVICAAERYRSVIYAATLLGALLGIFVLGSNRLRPFSPTTYESFRDQASVLSRVYWEYAPVIRSILGGYFGACMGLCSGLVAAVILVDCAPALSILYWLLWSACAGFCIAGGADLAFARILGTLGSPAADQALGIYINSALGAAIPGAFTLPSIVFCCWLGCLLPRRCQHPHVASAIVAALALSSLLVLETTSRYMRLFDGTENSYFGVDQVIQFIEGKLTFSPADPLYSKYPQEPVLMLIVLPIVVATTAGFISYSMRRERRAGNEPLQSDQE